MAKAFGLVAILVALYIGMSIYVDGIDRALGGVFAAIEPQDGRETPAAIHLTPAAQLEDAPAGAPAPRVRVTDAVRQRVASDLQEGARRRGY